MRWEDEHWKTYQSGEESSEADADRAFRISWNRGKQLAPIRSRTAQPLAQALKVPILQLLQDEHEKEMIPMYRNLEHYADPTAGDALSKTRIPQRGEVWFATRKNVAESHMVLVIRNGPSIANIVELYDKAYDDCYVVRIAPNICKYYSPARYSWKQYGHFIKRVGKLDEAEFRKVLNNLDYTHNFGR